MSGYGSGDRPGDEDPWRPPQDAGPGQPPFGQPPQYGGPPGPPPHQDPSTPQYPSAPPYGYGYPGGAPPAEPAQVPPVVHWASIAIITRSVLTILSTLVTFAQLDSILDEAQRRSTVVLDREALRGALVAGAIVSLVVAVLFILLALQVRRGKNWARIVAIVFASFGIAAGLYSLSQAGQYGATLNLLDTVNLLLAVATVVLLVLEPSRAYFRAMSQKRW